VKPLVLMLIGFVALGSAAMVPAILPVSVIVALPSGSPLAAVTALANSVALLAV